MFEFIFKTTLLLELDIVVLNSLLLFGFSRLGFTWWDLIPIFISEILVIANLIFIVLDFFKHSLLSFDMGLVFVTPCFCFFCILLI